MRPKTIIPHTVGNKLATLDDERNNKKIYEEFSRLQKMLDGEQEFPDHPDSKEVKKRKKN